MQGTGKGFEVEVRYLALDRPGVRVDVERRGAAVGVGHRGIEGEVRTVRLAEKAHRHVRFGLVQGIEHLLETQRLGIVAGFAGAYIRVGQPDDFLADHGQGAGNADDQDEKPDRQGEPAVHQEPQPGFGFFRFLGHCRCLFREIEVEPMLSLGTALVKTNENCKSLTFS
ncbi:hypothetical protein D3C80_1440400 [compost metagenome]